MSDKKKQVRGRPFKKGGDPRRSVGGRPKGWAEFTEAARAYGPEAIQKLVHLMRSAPHAIVQLKAAEALLARGYGSPVQANVLLNLESEDANREQNRRAMLEGLAATLSKFAGEDGGGQWKVTNDEDGRLLMTSADGSKGYNVIGGESGRIILPTPGGSYVLPTEDVTDAELVAQPVAAAEPTAGNPAPVEPAPVAAPVEAPSPEPSVLKLIKFPSPTEEESES